MKTLDDHALRKSDFDRPNSDIIRFENSRPLKRRRRLAAAIFVQVETMKNAIVYIASIKLFGLSDHQSSVLAIMLAIGSILTFLILFDEFERLVFKLIDKVRSIVPKLGD